MSNVTVSVPAGQNIFSIDNNVETPPLAPSLISVQADNNEALISPNANFTLYFWYSPRQTPAVTTVDVSLIAEALANGNRAMTGTAAYGIGGTTPAAIPTTASILNLTAGTTAAYIPYLGAITADFDVSKKLSNLSDIATGSPIPTITSTPSSPPAGTSSGSTTSSSIGPTSQSNSGHPSPNDRVSNGTLAGAVIGSVLGGLVIGVILCSLVGFGGFRHKRSTSRARKTSLASGELENETVKPLATASMDVTGWQKHLPQEKDDRTVKNTLKSIFEQVELYMDGSYRSNAGNVSRDALSSLEKLSPGHLFQALLRSNEPVPILQAILIRWIINRISLRSEAKDSLLPLELTQIPQMNGWHMESDSGEDRAPAESKNGFSQAFSQWRVLTTFLYQDSKTKDKFDRLLTAKIEKDARTLTDAFSPYEQPGMRATDRVESLERILHQASEAGILLFSQPSTFRFDWSGKGGVNKGDLVISPALVRRLDATAKALRPVDVLIEARTANA